LCDGHRDRGGEQRHCSDAFETCAHSALLMPRVEEAAHRAVECSVGCFDRRVIARSRPGC
jgi:hypothetical protein